MKIKTTVLRYFILILLLGITACQDEVNEATPVNEEETIVPNSTLSDLMLNTTARDGSSDDILDDSSCFSVVFPVTVIANDTTLIINTLEDLIQIEILFGISDDDEDTLEFVFPITIILSDYTEVVVTSLEELQAFIDDCTGTESFIDCIDFLYPISFSVYDTEFAVIDTITINSDEELHIFINSLHDDSADTLLVSLNFPVVMVYADGTIVTVNSNTELEDAINGAADFCDDEVAVDGCTEEDIRTHLQEYLQLPILNGTALESIRFEFNEDGTISKIFYGTVYDTGTWDIISTDTEMYLTINFTAPELAVYNGSWLITNCDDNRLEMVQGDDTLVLEVDYGCTNPEILIDDLIMYIPFADEVNDLVNDSSIGIAGISSIVTVTDRAGNPTCAFPFASTVPDENYIGVSVNENNRIIQGDAFTVSLWFKMQNTDLANYETLLELGTTAENGFKLGVYDLNTPLIWDKDSVSLWDDDWNYDPYLPTDDKNWHHLAVTVDTNNTVRLYRDGVLRNIIEDSTFDIGEVVIGDWFILGDEFTGHLDDVRVYKRALNDSDIDTLFNLEADCFTCL